MRVLIILLTILLFALLGRKIKSINESFEGNWTKFILTSWIGLWAVIAFLVLSVQTQRDSTMAAIIGFLIPLPVLIVVMILYKGRWERINEEREKERKRREIDQRLGGPNWASDDDLDRRFNP